jgi:hypothetical protein
MMTRQLSVATALAAVMAAGLAIGCGSASPTSPAVVGASGLQGTWASTAATTAQNTCTNYKWTVTSISGNTGSGTFSATCFGSLDVAGTGTGTLSGATLTWTAAGAATTLVGGVSCPFALSGTASFDSNGQMRVPYTGTTCKGPVSGTEVLALKK